VITDLHLYARSLGMAGPDFKAELGTGKKMLDISQEINETLAGKLIQDREVRFVIVCGDLTKDGERENHLAMKKLLGQIEASGKQVFVVPGNHDINNFSARRFTGSGSEPVPPVSPAEFREIYSEFGYSQALYSDPASLSYVAEPVPGLWLFAMDSCTYELNNAKLPASTAGRFKPESIAWIEEKLAEAREKNKAVIGLLHHGILEHFSSQKKYFRDFVVDDWEAVSKMFAHYGMKMAFTGHCSAHNWQPGQFSSLTSYVKSLMQLFDGHLLSWIWDSYSSLKYLMVVKTGFGAVCPNPQSEPVLI